MMEPQQQMDTIRRQCSGANSSFYSSMESMAEFNPSMDVQKRGFLHMKKFRKDALHNGNFSRPMWCILKDSFLIWYKYRPSDGIDLYPTGCLPLGGSVVFGPWRDEKNGGYIIEITHKGFNGYSLALRTELQDVEGVVAESWISSFNESKCATWENCVFGDAQLVQLENKTKVQGAENQKLMQQLKEDAAAAAIVANEKILLMEKKVGQDRQLKAELQQLQKEREQTTKQLSKVRQKILAKTMGNKTGPMATPDVISALEFIKGQISRLTPTLRGKIQSDFAELQDFIQDYIPSEIPELDEDQF